MEETETEIEKYLKYEKAKKKLLTKCKTFEQFERELKKLIDELKI